MNKIPDLNEYIESILAAFQSITDANVACEVMISTFSNGINKFSTTVKPCRRTPLKPWISPDILCSINRKNQLYKKYIRSYSISNEAECKQYRHILTSIIMRGKKIIFSTCIPWKWRTWKESLEAAKRSSKQQQNKKIQLPSSFTFDAGVSYTNKHVANGFNDFFTSVASI